MYTQQEIDDEAYRIDTADERFMASLSPREYALMHSQSIIHFTDDEYDEYSALFRAWVKALDEAASS